MTNIITPLNMWGDFDECAPINAALFQSYCTDKLRINEVFINGRREEEAVTRVFCVTVIPKTDKKLPAIIVLGDTDKGVSISELCGWAERGYIAVGIDYSGISNTGKTIYPECFSYCEYADNNRAYSFVDSSAADTVWYNYSYNTRSAINYIFTLPEFDMNNCMLLSFRDSDKIAVMVTASDKRINTLAIMFGDIWENLVGAGVSVNDEKSLNADNQDERTRYLAAIAPQAHLPQITVPLLVVQGANSYNTDMSRITEAVKSTGNNNSTRVIFLPRIMDAMVNDDEIARRWFYNYRKPSLTISASVRISEGRLIAAMDSMGAPQSAISIFYCRGNAPQSTRNWIRAKEKFSKGEYLAEIEVVNSNEPVTVIFNLIDSLNEVSTRIINVAPSELKGVTVFSEKTKIIYNGRREVGEFVAFSPYEPQTSEFIKNHPITYSEGSHGVGGVKGSAISTYWLNDSMIIYEEGAALTFDINCVFEQSLIVAVTTGWGSDKPITYQCTKALGGGDFWEKITLSCASFKSQFGKQLESFKQNTVLSFVAKNDVILNNIRFT